MRIGMQGLFFSIVLIDFVFASATYTGPAASVKSPDSTTFVPYRSKFLFLRPGFNVDLPLRGALGGEIALGAMGKYVFLDLMYSYYVTPYGAVKVFQPGVTLSNPLDPLSEVGRKREPTARGSLSIAGAGAGFIFKYFQIPWLVQIGRFGLNYVKYKDHANALTFHGGLWQFHGAAGLHWKYITIAPGITWNLALTIKTGPPSYPASRDYFPLQWWAYTLNTYFWIF